jgi:hypothetical protein
VVQVAVKVAAVAVAVQVVEVQVALNQTLLCQFQHNNIRSQ